MHIGRKNEEADYKMKVNEDEYRSTVKCNEEKDLGIIFNKSFSFEVHIQSCINKTNKMIGINKRTFTFLHKEMFNNLHKALIWNMVFYMVSLFEKAVSHNQKSTEKSH